MKIVILAEKPIQAFAYAEAIATYQKRHEHEIYLTSELFPNDEVIITWAEGHLIALDEPKQYDEKYGKFSLNNLPFFPETYRTHIVSKTKQQYLAVKKHLHQANLIILATDPDREGELVAYRIFQEANVLDKPIKRLWANSQEKEELRRAFRELKSKEFSYPYYIEAETRQLADYLVGMNLTQLVTLTMQKMDNNQGVYSVGRVQTPALSFVVENHLNIKEFQSEIYYQTQGKIHTEKGEILMKSPLKFTDKASFSTLLKEEGIAYNSMMKVVHVKETQTEQLPPPLLTLGSVQTLANQKWRYSLEQTLNILQKLYQKGYLSYPRTDCPFITEDVFQYLKECAPKFLSLFGRKESIYFHESRKQYVDDHKVLEHYAIVPTRKVLSRFQELNKEELNIYTLVVLQTLQIFLPNVQYTTRQVTGQVGKLEFVGTGRKLTSLGYLALFDYEPVNRPMFDSLSYLKEGKQYPIEILLHEIQTKPPKRLTQATLGASGGLMEKAKIGTPATRAHIVQTLLAREYIAEIKHQLFPTEKGMKLYRLLMAKKSILVSPEMTAVWERQLTNLEGERENQQAFLNEIKQFILNTIHQMEEDSSSIFEKSEEDFADLPRVEVSKNQKKQPKRNYLTLVKCPICHSLCYETKKTYQCSNKQCEWYFLKNKNGHNITEKQLSVLLNGEVTKEYKDFVSDEGKKFPARLKLKSLTAPSPQFVFDNKKNYSYRKSQ